MSHVCGERGRRKKREGKRAKREICTHTINILQFLELGTAYVYGAHWSKIHNLSPMSQSSWQVMAVSHVHPEEAPHMDMGPSQSFFNWTRHRFRFGRRNHHVRPQPLVIQRLIWPVTALLRRCSLILQVGWVKGSRPEWKCWNTEVQRVGARP